MTLILGVNLTDRIILATDSKVTKMNNGKREVAGYSIKLAQYNDLPMHKDKVFKTRKEIGNFISCMYAGNKDFAFFIHQKLSVAFENGGLSTDINTLQNQVSEFFKKNILEYEGVKKCLIIFAGVSQNGSIKTFSFKRFSDLVGPEGFHIDDPSVAGGLPFAFPDQDTMPLRNVQRGTFVPDQKVFSFEIDEAKSTFGIGKIGGAYSIVAGGSTIIDDELEKKVLQYFLSKRDIKKEAADIINFIRNNFSDTIGGAVVLGSIDMSGILTHTTYEIDRSGKISDKNWSVEFEDKNLIAIDPLGKKIDLNEGFFNGSGNSDWCL